MAQIKSLATVSGFTAVSRILGFLRDVLIAKFIGANMVTDAFFTAFRFPNMFRRIFGEGAFNAAFVPLFSKRLEEKGKEDALHFGNHTFSMLALVLGVASIVLIPAMPLVMSVVAPGFKAKVNTGWTAPGAQARPSYTAKITGAKALYFVMEREGEAGALPTIRLNEAILLNSEGTRTPLTEIATIPLEISKLGAVKIPLPKERHFKEVTFSPSFDWGPEKNAPVRLKVYRNDPDTFPLTVKLARITFLYLWCMALAAHLSGVLNTVRIFGMPAAAPIFLNVIFLIGLVAFVPWLGHGGEVLAWCVFVAGFVQLFALWRTCQKRGYPIHFVKPVVTPEMKRLFLLMGPGILSAGIQQINLLVGGVIASYQQNAVSYLYYSERVYQLPLGMVGIAFGVVLLPEITRNLRAGNEQGAHDSLNRGIEYSLFITLPAAIALVVAAFPIISGLFELGGDFNREASLATAPALAAFALGLPGYVLIKVLQPGYFSREDTKTPMFIAAATVLTNIIASLVLFYLLKGRGLGHIGIALATSLAAWVNVALLAIGLRRKGFLKLDARLIDRLWRIGAASVLMGGLLYALHKAIQGFMMSGKWQSLLGLVLIIGLGLASYVASALTLGAANAKELRKTFRRG